MVEEPPPSKASRKETTSGTSAEPVKNSSPAPPQPAPGKVEPGAGEAIGQCWDEFFVLLLSTFWQVLKVNHKGVSLSLFFSLSF